MIGVRSFYKKWSHLNGLSIGDNTIQNLKFVDVQFLVTVDIDVSCHVNSRVFQKWPKGEKYSLTYQWSIFSEKTKVTQFARLCRIMTCLPRNSVTWNLPLSVFTKRTWKTFCISSFKSFLENILDVKLIIIELFMF